MRILEFGDKDKQTIIFIHGFQMPYQILNDYIKHYRDHFHIIVPILPGHNSDIKEEFISFDECVSEIEKYVLNQRGVEIECIYALGMGGIVASKLLANKKLKVKYLFFESSPLVGINSLLTKLLTKKHLQLTHNVQKNDRKSIDKITTKVIPKDKLINFLDLMNNMSDDNVIKYLKAISEFELPNNLDVGLTKAYYFYGTKMSEHLSKKTVSYIRDFGILIQPITCYDRGYCEDFIFYSSKKIEFLDYILIDNVEI